MRYNTPIPSSAPVERVFSISGLVRTVKRNRMSDHMFETPESKLVVLTAEYWLLTTQTYRSTYRPNVFNFFVL